MGVASACEAASAPMSGKDMKGEAEAETEVANGTWEAVRAPTLGEDIYVRGGGGGGGYGWWRWRCGDR